MDAAGTVKWTLTSRRPVGHPAWSTGLGYAVAYLEGRSLKVVAGNGDPTTNRVLRRDAAPVTPAWRPHSDRVLTYATGSGALTTIDVQTGRTLWTASGRGGTCARVGTGRPAPRRTRVTFRNGPGSERAHPAHDSAARRRTRDGAASVREAGGRGGRPPRARSTAGRWRAAAALPGRRGRDRLVSGRQQAAARLARRRPVAPARPRRPYHGASRSERRAGRRGRLPARGPAGAAPASAAPSSGSRPPAGTSAG